MFSKLIVPVDGSEPSNAAVRLAIGFASQIRASLIFCDVVDVTSLIALSGATMDPGIVIESERELAREVVAKAVEDARRAGVPARGEVPEGEVVETVLSLVKQEGAGAVVMGSHGRGGLARAVLGSKAEGVLRRSPVPVLIAPPRAAVQRE
ncbi:MAG TPA: universal stress protein [Candidatus Dormibacteraeota bacterium]|nr:universal stress protein [Candidatus Dormibacteraeota bacterium]